MAIVDTLGIGVMAGFCIVVATLENTGADKIAGLIINGGGGRNCHVTIGVGVVGNGRENIDCCGSGDVKVQFGG
jgi:hypothetical protein